MKRAGREVSFRCSRRLQSAVNGRLRKTRLTIAPAARVSSRQVSRSARDQSPQSTTTLQSKRMAPRAISIADVRPVAGRAGLGLRRRDARFKLMLPVISGQAEGGACCSISLASVRPLSLKRAESALATGSIRLSRSDRTVP
jgi:hypothetical protein